MILERPSPGRITSWFGPRESPGGIGSTMHQGLDFSWSNNGVQNWNIYAAAPGTIESSQYSGGWGNLTIVNHGGGRKTYYAHQSRFLRYAGQWVNTGDIIGVIGNTGNSFGAHLHFEYRINGVPVDPVPYFAGTAGGGEIKPINPDEEEEEMSRNSAISADVGGVRMHAVFNTVSGFFTKWTDGGASYNANVKKTFGVTDPNSHITESHFNAIERSCTAVRRPEPSE